MGKRCEQAFPGRGYTNGEEAYESIWSVLLAIREMQIKITMHLSEWLT